MLNEDGARALAAHWIQAWNAHNLDEIMTHYADEVTLTSPVVISVLNDPSGTVIGKDALRAYFKRGLEVHPDLNFELVDTLWGLSSVVLYYLNQKYVDQRRTMTAEFMELNEAGKVIRVVANYNA
ncbi:MAG: nuclear transport factor 2 family protein [Gammaproteobacteria bacterium]